MVAILAEASTAHGHPRKFSLGRRRPREGIHQKLIEEDSKPTVPFEASDLASTPKEERLRGSTPPRREEVQSESKASAAQELVRLQQKGHEQSAAGSLCGLCLKLRWRQDAGVCTASVQQDPRPITLTVKGLTPSEQLRLQTLDLRELALRPLLETAELQVIEAQRAGSDDLVPLHELAKYDQEGIENMKEHFQLRRREGIYIASPSKTQRPGAGDQASIRTPRRTLPSRPIAFSRYSRGCSCGCMCS
ncbi:hypothetical protein WJX84_009726 [Apatococcus fuscideae]|uniref:Uncharacterized protein n=1 Tax=Apatococcus fuscideae TaxID=2026836 RepID=A0AAW1SYY2_9CHLO